MKYKDFKEKIEDWGRKHGYVARVGIDYHQTYIKVWSSQAFYFNTYISNRHRFALDTDYTHFKEIEEYARAELFDTIVGFAKTPLEDRDEKEFIIPLPGLVTTDGGQQYLSYKDCKFFASRRDETLKQIWKEELLKYVPEIYRQFAVERQYDYLYDMYIDEFEDYDEERIYLMNTNNHA